MAHVGFALLAACDAGFTAEEVATRLNLPIDWVRERIEAARLCTLVDIDGVPVLSTAR
jgi:hypothetical protein